MDCLGEKSAILLGISLGRSISFRVSGTVKVLAKDLLELPSLAFVFGAFLSGFFGLVRSFFLCFPPATFKGFQVQKQKVPTQARTCDSLQIPSLRTLEALGVSPLLRSKTCTHPVRREPATYYLLTT